MSTLTFPARLQKLDRPFESIYNDTKTLTRIVSRKSSSLLEESIAITEPATLSHRSVLYHTHGFLSLQDNQLITLNCVRVRGAGFGKNEVH